jgi:nascent polypeptide-associated complex subunit alpha
MMPGMNSRQAQQMMKKMGVQQVEIDDAKQVIIRCATRDIIIDNPQVSKVSMMGQKTWQIVGEGREQSLDTTPDINEEDIQTVMEQANVDEATAKKALEETSGDLAEAIMKLAE